MKIKHTIKLLSASVFGGILLASALPASAVNAYKTEGERLLDFINANFYNSGTGRYADHITTATLAKTGNADCWPAANTIQALNWGSVNDSKYTARLNSFIGAMTWYINGAGYGSTHGGQRFFDDNALVAENIMRAWAYNARSAPNLTAADEGLNYCFNNKDANWGLPQTEANLGQGHWYVGPGASQGVAFSIHSKVAGNTTEKNNAITFWTKINDPTMNIKTAANVINEGVQLVSGTWQVTSGPLPGATARTITLGCLLYNQTGDVTYLNTAKTIANGLMTKWYTAGGGLNAEPQLGGVGSVIALCQVGAASGDVTYKNAAKDICDYLMNSCKDNGGYYPANGLDWTVNRHGSNPPATVDLQSQVCAAGALLCYAYYDINGHLPPIN